MINKLDTRRPLDTWLNPDNGPNLATARFSQPAGMATAKPEEAGKNANPGLDKSETDAAPTITPDPSSASPDAAQAVEAAASEISIAATVPEQAEDIAYALDGFVDAEDR